MNRVDATRIRDVDAFHATVPYIMPKRTDAEISSQEHFDLTELVAYLKQRNESEGLNLKLFHACCTAIARTALLRPKMNIFIAGKRYWQRKDLTLAFVVKRKFEDAAEESLMTMKVKPDMTLDSISRLILGDVHQLRKSNSNDMDGTLELLRKLPRFILIPVFGVVRLMEFFGIVPAAIMKGDPNYCSIFLSNLGSIGAGAPYHHLSNYGTNSIMVTIGTLHKEKRLQPDGTEQVRDMLDVTFTLDERIADGFYFARSLKITRYLLEHPQLLAQPLGTPVPAEVLA